MKMKKGRDRYGECLSVTVSSVSAVIPAETEALHFHLGLKSAVYVCVCFFNTILAINYSF